MTHRTPASSGLASCELGQQQSGIHPLVSTTSRYSHPRPPARRRDGSPVIRKPENRRPCQRRSPSSTGAGCGAHLVQAGRWWRQAGRGSPPSKRRRLMHRVRPHSAAGPPQRTGEEVRSGPSPGHHRRKHIIHLCRKPPHRSRATLSRELWLAKSMNEAGKEGLAKTVIHRRLSMLSDITIIGGSIHPRPGGCAPPCP